MDSSHILFKVFCIIIEIMNALHLVTGRIVFCIATTFTIFSCLPSYVPNTVNAPLFSNKGEIQAAIYTGSAGIDPQLSYAISNHAGLLMNGSFADRTSESSDNFHKHNFVEIGGGYFSRFGNRGVVEVYGGFGLGNLEGLNESGFPFDYTKVNTTRYFIQPTVGFGSDIFDGGFTPRLVLVNLRQGSKSETGVFWEPVFTGKLGYKFLRFVFQFGLSFPFNGDQITFDYQPFLLSFGIEGIFRRKFESKAD